MEVKTLIAIPCFDMVHTDFMRCFLDLTKPEGTAYTVIKNTLIYSARNTIAQNAIKHGFDNVLWLDSDMVFSPDLLTMMMDDMESGIDFVSGLYFMRQYPSTPVVYSDVYWKVLEDGNVVTGKDVFLDYPKEQMFECAGAGFGCAMTSAKLLKDLVEKYGSPFTPLMGMGEDLAFCWRARKNGYKLYCDSRIKCGHIGTITFDESTSKVG